MNQSAEKRNSSRRRQCQGFSLIEILVVVFVVGIVATIAVGFVGGLKTSVDDQKLESDVQTVNSAVGVYLSMGGSLTGITDPQQVIDKLKTVTDAVIRERMPGMTGSMIDPRLQAVTTGDVPDGPFAEWNSADNKFEIITDGVPTRPIRVLEFELGEEPVATVSEARNPTMKYSAEDTWVWDYQDRATSELTGPTVVSVVDVAEITAPPSATASPPPPGTLDPPEFSIPGGNHPDTDFPLTLTLTDPNPAGASEIIYWINGDPPQVYSGPLSISPDDSVSAFANSLDEVVWNDSGVESQAYMEVIPPPDIEFTMGVSTSP